MITSHMYKEYADYVRGGAVTRLQAAEHFGVTKSTATYHLEKAVSEGLIVKFHAYADGNQTGWGYMSSDNPPLPFQEPEFQRGEHDDYWPDEPDVERLIESRNDRGY